MVLRHVVQPQLRLNSCFWWCHSNHTHFKQFSELHSRYKSLAISSCACSCSLSPVFPWKWYQSVLTLLFMNQLGFVWSSTHMICECNPAFPPMDIRESEQHPKQTRRQVVWLLCIVKLILCESKAEGDRLLSWQKTWRCAAWCMEKDWFGDRSPPAVPLMSTLKSLWMEMHQQTSLQYWIWWILPYL